MAVDVSVVVDAISGNAVAVAAVGAACLLVLVGLKALAWVRAALDGGPMLDPEGFSSDD